MDGKPTLNGRDQLTWTI